jgi:hypothetical protein
MRHCHPAKETEWHVWCLVYERRHQSRLMPAALLTGFEARQLHRQPMQSHLKDMGIFKKGQAYQAITFP